METKHYKEALEQMCCQFAFWTDGSYWTGGMSALEAAFDVLGWTDPQPAPEACCQEKGCKEQATCSCPTPEGYRHLCSKHYRILNG